MRDTTLRNDGIEVVRSERRPQYRRFQVIGLRCSGTNFLENLVELNTCLAHSTGLGWKHGFATMPFVPEDLLPIIVFRDPFEWLRSLYRKPWHYRAESANVPFGCFIREPVDTMMDEFLWQDRIANLELLSGRRLARAFLRERIIPRIRQRIGLKVNLEFETVELPEFAMDQALQIDRHPVTGLPFANPIEMRILKMRAFLGYANRAPCMFVRYETARDRPEDVLAMLRDAFEIELKPRFTEPGEWYGELPIGGERKVLPAFEPVDTRFVLEQLDHALEERVGYSGRLEWAAANPKGPCDPIRLHRTR